MLTFSRKMEFTDFDKKCTVFPSLHKFWGINEYDADHHQILKQREKNRMYFSYKSPQIQHRTSLVEWMKKIATLKKLDNNSVHLAVYLLDVFMDNHHIEIERLYHVVLVCLLLATKFEERDIKCLKSEDLNKIIENKYPLSDYYALEIRVLQHIKWNLFLPTAVQFVNYYIGYLFSEDDLISSKFENYSELWCNGKIIVQSYLDCVIADLDLMQRRPSLVAASIIAGTRLELGLSTIWPAQIIIVTGFKLFDLKNTVSRLRKILKSKKDKFK